MVDSGAMQDKIDPIPFPRTFREACRQFFGNGASAHPVVQFLKYGFVGGLATAVNIIAFSAFAWWVFPCVTQDDLVVKLFGLTAPAVEESRRATLATYSNASAWVFANAFCYVLNRIFVFKPGRLPMWLEFLSFSAVGGFATVVGTAVMAWLVASFGIQTSVAFVANMVAALVFNYVLRKYVIFKG